MFEYGRLDQLFQIVRSSAFTPASKLSDVLGVTERTITQRCLGSQQRT